MAERRWRFTVRQGGMIVAQGSAPDMQSARTEALHYGRVYAQDGPTLIVIIPPEPCAPKFTTTSATDG